MEEIYEYKPRVFVNKESRVPVLTVDRDRERPLEIEMQLAGLGGRSVEGTRVSGASNLSRRAVYARAWRCG